jgi:ribosomal protein L40E
MPTKRSNLTRPPITLDEQSFQGLLAAAFTIQEHNYRRQKTQQEEAEAESQAAADRRSVCPQCGARKPKEGSPCESCGAEEFRPGERLQRNWASMWLMSQEQQGLWPERSAESVETAERERKDLPPDMPLFRTEPVPRVAADDVTASNSLALPVAHSFETTASASTWDKGANETADAELAWKPAADDCAITIDAVEAPGIEGEQSIEGVPDETRQAPSHTVLQRMADLQITLRFHRADLYLGVAVFIALLALLWPAATAPRPATLGPWEKFLVNIGVAEAPAPVVHFRGDPAIEVWADPHTALYYCPGDEPYGKTPDGRLTSQREAQLDRFEPAGRSVCE